MTSKKLLIVDGHNILFKSFAVSFKFYSTKGIALHVLTAFLSQIRKVITEIKPQYLIIIWDTQEQTQKHKDHDFYKANRIKNYSNFEDSPFHHLENIKKLLQILHITNIEIKGFEADEIIATAAHKFNSKSNKNQTYIFSNDLDFYQLLSNNVSLVNIKRKEINVVTPKWLMENLGIRSDKYVLFKSLTGDRADNIRGIPNIGAKRAAKIINKDIKFDFEKFYKILEINKKLITLNTNLKIDFDFNNFDLMDNIINIKNSVLWRLCDF